MVKGVDRAVRHRLGARIRALRATRQLTQQTLADRIDRSQKYLSELERGQRSPSWETLVAIAHQGLEIKLAALMFGIDEDLGDGIQEVSKVLIDRETIEVARRRIVRRCNGQPATAPTLPPERPPGKRP